MPTLRGAALLFRRSDFEGVGGFDETFFLYAEETDLLLRLAARGRGLLYVPEARVTHVGGGSAGDALFGELHAGLRHYVEKHHGRMAARAAGVFLFFGAAARWLLALVTPGRDGTPPASSLPRGARSRDRFAMTRKRDRKAFPG